MAFIMTLVNRLPRIQVISPQRILPALGLVHVFILAHLVQNRHILQTGTFIRFADIVVCTFAADAELGIGELDALAGLAVLDEYEVARDEVAVDVVDDGDGEGFSG